MKHPADGRWTPWVNSASMSLNGSAMGRRTKYSRRFAQLLSVSLAILAFQENRHSFSSRPISPNAFAVQFVSRETIPFITIQVDVTHSFKQWSYPLRSDVSDNRVAPRWGDSASGDLFDPKRGRPLGWSSPLTLRYIKPVIFEAVDGLGDVMSSDSPPPISFGCTDQREPGTTNCRRPKLLADDLNGNATDRTVATSLVLSRSMSGGEEAGHTRYSKDREELKGS